MTTFRMIRNIPAMWGLPCLVFVCLLGFTADAWAGSGSIKGQVIDRDTKSPIAGATVRLSGTPIGKITDTSGVFTIENLSSGSYVLNFSHLGYETPPGQVVLVKSNRITPIVAELKQRILTGRDIVVTSGLFSEDELRSAGTIEMLPEEIRRAAGSVGDVCRVAPVLPSVAKARDENLNLLIVRGGNPMENGFILDNIEVPTINHFPVQGTSAGGVGLLNNDYIKGVTFHSGGFSAAYANRLSSYMNISIREGNRYEFGGQFDVNVGGICGAIEGPLPGKRGSWFLSARHSSLDLLKDALELFVAPSYDDLQTKIVYDLTTTDRLSALAIVGRDKWSWTRDEAERKGSYQSYYGSFRFSENAIGLNWLRLWGNRGHSKTSISFTRTKFDMQLEEMRLNDSLLSNVSAERAIGLRNVNNIRLGRTGNLEFGARGKLIFNTYDNMYYFTINPIGGPSWPHSIDTRITAQEIGLFAQYSWQVLPRLTTTAGARADYFSFNGNMHFAPRVSCSYQVSGTFSINAAAGLYHQPAPMILLAQLETREKPDDPAAGHVVVGFNYLLLEDTRLGIEAYAKEYRRLPLDHRQPHLFILDELLYDDPIFSSHPELDDNGRAFARGVELFVHKKQSGKINGMIGASYSRSRYRDYSGIWRDRVVDGCFAFSALVGFQPTRNWDFGARWSYADGTPYTPYDRKRSWGIGIYDTSRINAERLPPYHSLYVRLERRFHFAGSNIITYISLWNAYNRENIIGYTWSTYRNRPLEMTGWGIVPVAGIKYEF